jgi:hypothetical protein
MPPWRCVGRTRNRARQVANPGRCDYTGVVMKSHNEKIPDPKEIEKEISEFLSKKFKDNVKIVSPVVLHQSLALEKPEPPSDATKKINFDLLPEDLIAFLDQYIVKQARANRCRQDVHHQIDRRKNRGPVRQGRRHQVQ